MVEAFVRAEYIDKVRIINAANDDLVITLSYFAANALKLSVPERVRYAKYIPILTAPPDSSHYARFRVRMKRAILKQKHFIGSVQPYLKKYFYQKNKNPV